MLILKRNLDEAVRIGDATATVVEIDPAGQWVRLGFDAPPSVEIWRDELAGAVEANGNHREARLARIMDAIHIDQQLTGSDVARWVYEVVQRSARGIHERRDDLREVARVILSEAERFARTLG